MPAMLDQYVKRILQSRVYDVALETPIHAAPLISRRIGNRVLLKREDLQPVFSFKLRGAYNKLASLTDAQRSKGVICASAGNHAQGLALAASAMGVRAVIVMPRTTPEIKVKSVRERGGKVVLHGDGFDDALAHATKLQEKEGLTFVHPYDDPDVIAGQGTVGMEILRQQSRDLDAIFIPVGGGGLAAGIAAYVKYVRPEVKIIAVEPEDAACLQAAMLRKRRVTLSEVGLFADGVAVRQIGKETFRILRDHVDEVITATTDEICAAIKDSFEDTRAICEPAGALALAAVFGSGAYDGATHPSLAFLTRGWQPMPARDLGLFMACGVIASIGLSLLTYAYRVAPSASVAPFEHTNETMVKSVVECSPDLSWALVAKNNVFIRRSRSATSAQVRSGEHSTTDLTIVSVVFSNGVTEACACGC